MTLCVISVNCWLFWWNFVDLTNRKQQIFHSHGKRDSQFDNNMPICLSFLCVPDKFCSSWTVGYSIKACSLTLCAMTYSCNVSFKCDVIHADFSSAIRLRWRLLFQEATEAHNAAAMNQPGLTHTCSLLMLERDVLTICVVGLKCFYPPFHFVEDGKH